MRQDDETMLKAAVAYHGAGLCVLPAIRKGDVKRPRLREWTCFQSRQSSLAELTGWFSGRRAAGSMCVVTGAVSNGLEMIDFDLGGDAFDPWRALVQSEAPGLLDRLIVESTPSGGRHAAYRCAAPVGPSTKLAMRRFPVQGPGEHTIAGKRFKARCDPGSADWFVDVTLVETRGEGGVFLCAPSPGYKLVQGNFTSLPIVTADERDILLAAARSLNEMPADPVGGKTRKPRPGSALRPGDDFNARGDIRPILEDDGWRLVRRGENEHWCRPGKTSGTSATLKGGVFYVFTSNAPPFEPGQAYSPFAVLSLLRHSGNFSNAAQALTKEGFGMPPHMQQFAPYPFAHIDPGPVSPDFVSVQDLVGRFTGVRPPVVHGLIREGETMNVIAAPKTGKSWLALDLAISVATGGQWLGRFACEQGSVLILDNELHPETCAQRVPLVAGARGVGLEAIGDRVFVESLRGRLLTTTYLTEHLDAVQPGRFKVIILDAFYRFMPPGFSENDNGQMASVYNELDRIADRLKCCFVLIHHTSKGEQHGRAVTDVGAGAGSQSRATDTHLILRRHREQGAVVLEATVRSWPPLDPVCLRWRHPVWEMAPELDPAAVASARRNRQRDAVADGWTAESFVEAFLECTPRSRAAIVDAAAAAGLSKRKTGDLLRLVVEQGLVAVKQSGRNRPQTFTKTGSVVVPKGVA